MVWASSVREALPNVGCESVQPHVVVGLFSFHLQGLPLLPGVLRAERSVDPGGMELTRGRMLQRGMVEDNSRVWHSLLHLCRDSPCLLRDAAFRRRKE